MQNNKLMFTCVGFRPVQGRPFTDSKIQALFMTDGSIREARGEGDQATWLLLGSWRWSHEECCIEVLIPGRTVDLHLDQAITRYLSWLAKQVVN